MDIGRGFVTASFQNLEDRTRILRDGPWFLNQRFLSIRRWEPKFDPNRASMKSVAVWIRLSHLPIEFYNPTIIKKAANRIGPLLHVDGLTAMGERANFARLCIQVNFEKPLPSHLKIAD